MNNENNLFLFYLISYILLTLTHLFFSLKLHFNQNTYLRSNHKIEIKRLKINRNK